MHFKQLLAMKAGSFYSHCFTVTALVLFSVVLFSPGCKSKQPPPPVPYGKNETTGKFAAVNGIQLYYEIYGSGQPLVLIHGNGGSIASGREQIAYFSKKYQVIAVDSRGQGRSKDESDSLTYDAIAADLNTLLDQLKIDSAYMIGQSDGAIVGLIMGFRYPAKVKMLAAMAPNIRPDSAVLYPKVEASGTEEFTRYEDSLKNGNTRVLQRVKLLRLMKYHPHISTEELASIKAPVMVMCGDRDVIRLSHIIEIFRAIPNANLCVLPASTHTALRRNPLVFNETIDRFFSKPFSMPDSY